MQLKREKTTKSGESCLPGLSHLIQLVWMSGCESWIVSRSSALSLREAEVCSWPRVTLTALSFSVHWHPGPVSARGMHFTASEIICGIGMLLHRFGHLCQHEEKNERNVMEFNYKLFKYENSLNKKSVYLVNI